MAPDLNSVPASPRDGPPQTSTASSRRMMVSQSETDPSLSSATMARRESFSTAPPLFTAAAAQTIGTGPGPLRHPRPLTAAELHLEVEKENEAVVNRLSRELSSLRQQSASVASTASSTSTGLHEAPNVSYNHLISGPVYPTASRQHRSSSNLSNQSASLTGTGASTVMGIAPARDVTGTTIPGRGGSSRHNSMNTRRPGTTSPLVAVPFPQQAERLSEVQHNTTSYTQTMPPHGSSVLTASNLRIEEISRHRAEMEYVRQENIILRQRVRELERELGRVAHPPSNPV